MYMQFERNDLTKRVRPGKPNTDDLRGAVGRCFDFADAVAQERKRLAHEPGLNAAARRDALGRFVNSDLFQPLAGALEPARRLKAHVLAERAKLRPGVSLSSDLAELHNDVQAVEAALYFAKREVEGASRAFGGNPGLSSHDLDALLTGQVS